MILGIVPRTIQVTLSTTVLAPNNESDVSSNVVCSATQPEQSKLPAFGGSKKDCARSNNERFDIKDLTP